MTSATGDSGLRPSASTRERRSRSVTIPHPSRPSTSSDDTRSPAIVSAACRTLTLGSHVTGRRRMSEPAETSRGSARLLSVVSSTRMSCRRSVELTKARPLRVPSTCSASSASIK